MSKALSEGQALREAARRLGAGELLIHPTEAVYGFGCLLDEEPLRALTRIKGGGRSGFVVLLPDAEAAYQLVPDWVRPVVDGLWPCSLTLVVADEEDRFPAPVKAPDGSVAVRREAHALTATLLEVVGRPMTSTSANVPGEPPARSVEEAERAAARLGVAMFALPGGELPGSPPSTILDVRERPARVIREGRILNEVRALIPVAEEGSHER